MASTAAGGGATFLASRRTVGAALAALRLGGMARDESWFRQVIHGY